MNDRAARRHADVALALALLSNCAPANPAERTCPAPSSHGAESESASGPAAVPPAEAKPVSIEELAAHTENHMGRLLRVEGVLVRCVGALCRPGTCETPCCDECGGHLFLVPAQSFHDERPEDSCAGPKLPLLDARWRAWRCAPHSECQACGQFPLATRLVVEGTLVRAGPHGATTLQPFGAVAAPRPPRGEELRWPWGVTQNGRLD